MVASKQQSGAVAPHASFGERKLAVFASEACDGDDGEPYDKHVTPYARLCELAPA